jgi:hypothetical protein
MADNIEIKGDSVTIDSLRGLSVIGTLYLNDTNVNTFINSITQSSNVVSLVNTPPGAASFAGTQGQIAYDSNYMYVCTAPNTWKRTAISSW